MSWFSNEKVVGFLEYLAIGLIALGVFAASNGDVCNYNRLDELRWVEGIIEDVDRGKRDDRDDLAIRALNQDGYYRYYIYDHDVSKLAERSIGDKVRAGYMDRCFFDLQGVLFSCRYVFELKINNQDVLEVDDAVKHFDKTSFSDCESVVFMYWGALLGIVIAMFCYVRKRNLR